jgi:redox-sensitive bicupin YhaK (pirin superfamily)
MAYVLTGQGTAGPQQRPVRDHELVEFGPGDNLVLRAADRMSGGWDALDVLLLGGVPIREPIAHYGPFVMTPAMRSRRPSPTTRLVGSASFRRTT